jgi:hypothetical protein
MACHVYSALDVFSPNAKISDTMLTGFASHHACHDDEVNLLQLRCPFVLCITDIHVVVNKYLSADSTSLLAPQEIRLAGLLAFIRQLAIRLQTLATTSDQDDCSWMSCSQEASPSHNGLPTAQCAQLLTIVGFTHQHNLTNTNVVLRDVFQHEVSVPNLSESDMQKLASCCLHDSFYNGTDRKQVSRRMNKFSQSFGVSHMKQYINEVRSALHSTRWNLHTSHGPLILAPPAASSCISIDGACDIAEKGMTLGGWLSGAEATSPLGSDSQQPPKGKSGQAEGAKMLAVQWSDIGGLDRVREEIMDTLLLPRKFPGLFEPSSTSGMTPPRQTGMLLFGPPGSGKTMVAKAVATECGMNFISIKVIS